MSRFALQLKIIKDTTWKYRFKEMSIKNKEIKWPSFA